jgi:hypothetical protein
MTEFQTGVTLLSALHNKQAVVAKYKKVLVKLYGPYANDKKE